ncbi:MAG: sulfite exporter TauE/SafE family protein [Bacteroides sp.]|nr:sulfite exporter TauE/SafE family protein [Eubacterium sp.]MCM1417993.1 sulfite exporter TauE/SafE family protein [Roseburia sp.]MCM1462184.1 sulfite exporter TauE/SafE family protein [Bacteroides sp.]
MKKAGEKAKFTTAGLLSGVLNGLFGSGGGTAAVPFLERTGLEPRMSHATSVALIFFLSLSATIGYWLGGNLDLAPILPMIPGGFLGAAVGAAILKKIDNDLLRRIFGGLLLFAAIRIFIR